MAMTYGSIDKSKDRRNNLESIISNLTVALELLQASEDFYEKNKVEQFLQDSLKSTQQLKG